MDHHAEATITVQRGKGKPTIARAFNAPCGIIYDDVVKGKS
jgi:hypothetical protein